LVFARVRLFFSSPSQSVLISGWMSLSFSPSVFCLFSYLRQPRLPPFPIVTPPAISTLSPAVLERIRTRIVVPAQPGSFLSFRVSTSQTLFLQAPIAAADVFTVRFTSPLTLFVLISATRSLPSTFSLSPPKRISTHPPGALSGLTLFQHNPLSSQIASFSSLLSSWCRSKSTSKAPSRYSQLLRPIPRSFLRSPSKDALVQPPSFR